MVASWLVARFPGGEVTGYQQSLSFACSILAFVNIPTNKHGLQITTKVRIFFLSLILSFLFYLFFDAFWLSFLCSVSEFVRSGANPHQRDQLKTKMALT